MADIRAPEDKTKEDVNKLLEIETAKASGISAKTVIETGAETGKQQVCEVKNKEDFNKILKTETAKLKYPNDNEKASRIIAKKVIETDAKMGKQQIREVFHMDVVEMVTERDANASPMTPGRLIKFDQDQEKSSYRQKGVAIPARKDSPPISPVTDNSTSYSPKK